MNSNNSIKITFLGAAGTVTGSKFLISSDGLNILIDCGLFQGLKYLRELNWKDLPFPPSEIDAVILTHAHLDHCGYLPRLVKQGFSGPVYCTAPTRDIAEIILTDSARIQEEDAEHANDYGYSRHSPALPLYNLKDVQHTMPLLEGYPDNDWIKLTGKTRFRFRKAAHIPGACFIEMDLLEKRFVFSGDIGRPGDPMLPPPEKPEHADYLFVESTYGDRLHPTTSTEEILKKIIDDTVSVNGTLIVPSFTVDRAQDFMYVIWKMKKYGKIPDIPVYLDSPMGIDVSRIFQKYPNWLKLGTAILDEVFGSTKMIHSVQETEHLAENKNTKIIIAGSGMMNGGRILRYLKTHLGNPSSTVIIPGYQAAGTRGRMISEGAQEIKIHGHYFEVKAHVANINTMSSHADQKEIIDWLANLRTPPEKVFIVHGEQQASDALRVKLKDTRGWNITIPHLGQGFDL
ncbi:MAG: MBL fold metallo-hydrolase [Bacteroidales bacterium]|nr:MBL fold metallo-hydrolase [Bacteroidales bacterium]